MVSAMADSENALEFLAADLAPGERKALELDCSELELRRICSETDSLFDVAYDHLWNEFGSKNEMESRPVIAHRLGWHPATQLDGYWLRYEIIMVRHRTRFVAVRDHTAIVSDRRPSRAIVHLSHVLIEPGWRRTGLAGWLRAWPLQTARACLAAAGHAVNSPITLVAEMEHPEPQFPNRLIRLRAYEKAGFKKIDPEQVRYFQPDFRPPEQIDGTGGPQPLPFCLVVRRVGRETEGSMSGAEVRELVDCLYRMYAVGFRAADMAVVWQSLSEYPADEAAVALLPPAQ